MSGRRPARFPLWRAGRGYLLVLVAVCVSMLSISFLRLAANSAKADDDAESEVANSVAYYAAESGLIAAELKLRRLSAAPPAGPWLAGSLQTSGAKYSVEVVSGAKTEFVLVCKGQTEGERGRKITTTLEAAVAQGPGKAWTVRSRKRL